MTDVLARIVARKRAEVAERFNGPAVASEPSTRSLRAALARPGARFIMEVKRRSPSGHRSRVTVNEAVRAYAPVADAISVLTDEPDFGGSLDDLRVARRLFDGPILAKDFIVDPRQVVEARAAGADAVLAMLSVLSNSEASAVIAVATSLAMDVVAEVHDEQELVRAAALGATIIGINNRDLKSLQTDLAVTERLARLAPRGTLLISESGIRSHRDVERLANHVDAFLVGSSLMAAPSITEAARALVHGRVKLCGLTRPEDLELAGRRGASHAGLIMVPESPRTVKLDIASALSAAAHEMGMKAVGVFRDAPVDEVSLAADRLQLDAVQLHGREGDAIIQELRGHLDPSTEIWALCGVDRNSAQPRRAADRTLFDTVLNGRSGGTGSTFAWSAVANRVDLSEAFLAGGIGPDNAREASLIGAYGLDVGSAIEAAPGIKDPARMKALFEQLRPSSRGEQQ